MVESDPYILSLAAIARRINAIEEFARQHPVVNPGRVAQDLEELGADRYRILQHWRRGPVLSYVDASENCVECGEESDCSTARRIFSRYLLE